VYVLMSVFSVPKDGNTDDEWEDKAVARPDGGDALRFLVLDGATEAFDTVRWVNLIASSYAPASTDRLVPRLDRDDMYHWFRYLQKKWADDPPAFANLMQERKFHETGSFATMLAGTVTGLAGARPRWQAMALGDTVLFHVRGTTLLEHFPELTDADFGLRPFGVSTKPAKLTDMADYLDESGRDLEAGDVLFVATDALAHWMLRQVEHDATALFAQLGDLDHPDSFAALIGDRRAADEMVNDDVTLLRLRFSDTDPSHLVVCL
jgi:hypothetical protein